MIDIKGIDKAVLLRALFNASRQQGMGMLDSRGAVDMTLEDAQKIVAETTYFDYLRGRVMKVEIGGDVLQARAYDRDNGEGAADRVVAGLRRC